MVVIQYDTEQRSQNIAQSKILAPMHVMLMGVIPQLLGFGLPVQLPLNVLGILTAIALDFHVKCLPLFSLLLYITFLSNNPDDYLHLLFMTNLSFCLHLICNSRFHNLLPTPSSLHDYLSPLPSPFYYT